MELAAWRGTTDARIGATGKRVDDLHTDLLAQFQRQETNFNRRMDRQDATLGKQDEILEKMLDQVKLTNGRVTALETVEKGREHIAEQETSARHETYSKSQVRLFKLSIVVAVLFGVGGVLVSLLTAH